MLIGGGTAIDEVGHAGAVDLDGGDDRGSGGDMVIVGRHVGDFLAG